MKKENLGKMHELEDALGIEPIEPETIIYKARKKDTSILTERNLTEIFDGGWSVLHVLAHEGVTEVLNYPDSIKVVTKDPHKETVLHFLAARKCVDEILQFKHPDTLKDARGDTPLHSLVSRHRHFDEEDLEKILKHSDVGTIQNARGETVLHLLDYAKEALNHSNVATVKDSSGNTALHKLAHNGIDVKNHPMANIVKNNQGKTPLDLYDGMTIKERVQRRLK